MTGSEEYWCWSAGQLRSGSGQHLSHTSIVPRCHFWIIRAICLPGGRPQAQALPAVPPIRPCRATPTSPNLAVERHCPDGQHTGRRRVNRLTESGLSIVDWAPIVGSVPPLSDADWDAAFARSRQHPEYVKLLPSMTLSECKYISFWAYLHRMIGRLVGMTFLVPFLWFWIRGYLNGLLARRALTLFALGGLQGLMGWYMVKCGLVDRRG